MSSRLPPGFMVLHSNRLEGLRDLYVEVVRRHPLPPLAPEAVLVQSNGMRHWLEVSLAQHLGVCAATTLELPARLLWRAYRQVLGAERVAAHMPLDKATLQWRLVRLVPALLQADDAGGVFDALRHYLQADSTHGADQGAPLAHAPDAGPVSLRLYQLAGEIADVFDGYQNYRSDWLDDWAQGQDVLRDARAQAQPMPTAQRWQPALWRAVLHDVTQGDHGRGEFTSRADVHRAFLQALRERPADRAVPGLPQRICVFGVTSLPMQSVEAFAALGQVAQVLMLVHNPCQYHWGDLVQARAPLQSLLRQAQRRHPPKAGLPSAEPAQALDLTAHYQLHTDGHPLLAAWGKQGRDYLHLLDQFDDVARYRHHFQRVDVFLDPCDQARAQGRAATQLEQLQSDILNLQGLPDTPRAKADDDDSLRAVQTHGPLRELEVLHDQLWQWLDADPSLQPQDIMVMVPDMATFGAHIHAVFGRHGLDDPRHQPYSVADVGVHDTPLVRALALLLQLPSLRLTLAEWQAWLEVDLLRQRFGLDEAAAAQLTRWLADAGVRWGLDATHRATWGMPPDHPDGDQNSWLFGLQRLLLGYASGPHAAVWQDTLAEPGVGGLDAPQVQGLLGLLRALETTLGWLQQAHTPRQWVRRLQALLDDFFCAEDDAQARLLERVRAPLQQWLAECDMAALDEALPLAVVRSHWLAQLQQPSVQQRFLGGGVQFATLMPMRNIPFRIVCLLGMGEADYPRRQTPRAMDLMALDGQWRAGDRSRRDDDRYLFLEAVLSARERLYLSWPGRRSTDHERQPPSVLVAQLLEHLRLAWQTPRPDPALPVLDQQAPLQPLQAFSPAYFRQGSGLCTYASEWQRVHLSADAPNPPPPPAPPATARSDARPLPEALDVGDLVRLLRDPMQVFLRQRLQAHLAPLHEAQDEDEPFAWDSLGRFLHAQDVALADDGAQAVHSLRLRGALALAGLGTLQAEQLLQQRETLQERWQSLASAWPEALDAPTWDASPPAAPPWPLPGLPIHRLTAQALTSPHTHAAGTRWRTRGDGQRLQAHWRPGAVLTGSRKDPQPRLDTLTSLWALHLAACAHGTPTTSVLLGLDATLQLQPLSATQALSHLQDLASIWLTAWQAPLPVPRKTACAWVLAQHASHDPVEAARKAFEGDGQRDGEWAQSASLRWAVSHFDELVPRLAEWAPRLYGPLLAHVTMAVEASA